ncbi:hypothetical protein GY21_15010 [Cryobacterium roopkundense]|uniref:Uncharacterized protein n=1 Tax=Cryobacterium roopkundense TaxID=1001240 RepID=A0A099J4U8_9MICO|nr:hypothetical protein [Cryobacterium roopkundense]KGJ72478.1 hypothetical protein GY21_15010 [Cryobacterium roopkundense]MBB5642239.1 hypothetical protein [Cryobacterium roopkundense]
MTEVIAALAGVIIGACLALGGRVRGAIASVVAYAFLVSSMIWLSSVVAPAAGIALAVMLFVAFASTKAVLWNNLPSLQGMSFGHRALMAITHARRLSREDTAIRRASAEAP